MIPVLFEKDTYIGDRLSSNGLGRLPDCLSCKVTEERNGIYECEFTYPVGGINFDKIQLGRIIGVTHDETDYFIQPFDIVSYSKPIDGIVTFHAVHCSYRLGKIVTNGTNVSSLTDAMDILQQAAPGFNFLTDMTSSAYAMAFDGVPKAVRSFLGGVEGSILDTYGGELEFSLNNVTLHYSRGQKRNFAIRYGVNMTDYTDETDCSEAFTACVPYWKGENTIVGSQVDSGLPSFNGRNDCIPLDLTSKFETEPTTAQLEAEALTYMTTHRANAPAQNITVDFVRLQDLGFEDLGSLMKCNLCDTIEVLFPEYGMSGLYKIVRVVWDVLTDRYEEMELGSLRTTLSEALGITNAPQVMTGGGVTPADYVTEEGTSGSWYYRKWSSGLQEAWFSGSVTFSAAGTQVSGMYRSTKNVSLPLTFADDAVVHVSGAYSGRIYTTGGIKSSGTEFEAQALGAQALAATTYSGWNVYVIGNARS